MRAIPQARDASRSRQTAAGERCSARKIEKVDHIYQEKSRARRWKNRDRHVAQGASFMPIRVSAAIATQSVGEFNARSRSRCG